VTGEQRCVFCDSVAGLIPVYLVYEDASTMASMVRDPIRHGHLLVFPKAHIPDFYALDEGLYHAVMQTTRLVGQAIATTLKPLKVGVAIVEFDFPHTHVNLIPIYQEREITTRNLFGGDNVPATTSELEAMAKLLQGGIARESTSLNE
jgi:diadenosine tetraphosphate (Ap4A) HIT family hydrolase